MAGAGAATGLEAGAALPEDGGAGVRRGRPLLRAARLSAMSWSNAACASAMSCV